MFGVSQKHERVLAVADIESASAGLAVIKIPERGPVEVLAQDRRMLSFEERTPQASLSALFGLLAETSEKVSTLYAASGIREPILDCHVIVHTPLSRSVSIRAATAFDEEIPITDAIIAGLARKALSEHPEPDANEPFESGVMRVKLNGYQTTHPVGKSAHHIEVTALESFSDPSFASAIRVIFEKHFPRAKISMRSGSRAAISIVRNSIGHSEECLIIDMTGDATSFVRFDADTAFEHHIISDGYRTILTHLAKGGLPEDSLSVLRMIERDDATTTVSEHIRTSLALFESELLRSYGKALGALSSQRRFPEDLVLFVHHDFAPWLSGFFSRIDFASFTTTLRPFTVHVVAPETLTDEIIFADGRRDTGLAVAATLVNRESRRENSM